MMNTSPIIIMMVAVMMSFINTAIVSAFDCPGSNTPPLVLKGKRFYDSTTNEYFPIKGIAYYPRPNDGRLSVSYSVDFFTDEFQSRWESDIEVMKELGVNAIRLYAVDPSKNHDAFMCALSEAGIYITLGLLADCEGCAIGAWVGNNAEPPLCYPLSVKERGQFVIKSFSKYDNVIGFSAGNEVTIYADDGNNGPREVNAPCQKKFLNDMRKFVSGCSNGGGLLPRSIPIGIENWDGNAQTFDQHVYYHCRTDPNDTLEDVEWFGINSYRHCDGSATSSNDIVGWPELRDDFVAANFPGPVIFGEYGCREQGFPTIDGWETQRTWLQTSALYTPDYSDVFAGGFVFEFSAEKKPIDDNLSFMANQYNLNEPSSEWPYKKFARNNFGVGYFEPIDCEHDDGDSANFCNYIKYPEFQGLAESLAKADTSTVRQQQPGAVPDCPQRFPPLSSIDWPTDNEDDEELILCQENRSISDTTTLTPTAAPSVVTTSPTVASTAATTTTIHPTSTTNDNDDTLSATTAPSSVVSIISTASPTAASTTINPTSTTNDNDDALSATTAPSSVVSASPTAASTTTNPTSTTNDNDGSSPATNSPTTVSSSKATSITTAPTSNDDGNAIVSPTSLPTVFTMSNQCLDHSRCSAQNLTGSCCPTLDAVSLGCCDVLPTSPPTSLNQLDQNGLESSSSWMVDYCHYVTLTVLISTLFTPFGL